MNTFFKKVYRIFSLKSTLFLLIWSASMVLSGCAEAPPSPSTPEIPGTKLITLNLPAHQGTLASSGAFQYSAPDNVSYFVLVIGDTGGATPLKVTGQLLDNVRFGSTSDLGMGRNTTSVSSIRNYSQVTNTFTTYPAAGTVNSQSWMVIGFDSNMNLVASSPKWDLNSITF